MINARDVRRPALITSVCMLAATVFGGPPSERSDGDPNGAPEACPCDTLWAEVMAIDATENKPNDCAELYWHEVGTALNNWYLKAVDEHGIRCVSECLMHHFGRHDSIADTRIILTNPLVWLAINSPRPRWAVRMRPDPEEDVLETEADLWYILVQKEACRAEVMRFSEDPNIVGRYYQALLAGRTPFGGPIGNYQTFLYQWNMLQEVFTGNTLDAQYWWSARMFIILAHATESDDCWIGTEPAEMHAAYLRWQKRLSPHVLYLLPIPDKSSWGFHPEAALSREWPSQDLQALPTAVFPDWPSGPIPPMPLNYFQVSAQEYPVTKYHAKWIAERLRREEAGLTPGQPCPPCD